MSPLRYRSLSPGSHLAKQAALGLLFSAACFLAADAIAATRLTYTMAGAPTPLYWPTGSFPITYTTEPRVANTIGMETVNDAFEAWSRVQSAHIEFRNGGVVQGTRAGHDSVNAISFMDSLFRDQGFVAVTTYWNDDSGRIRESDIQLDPTYVGPMYPALQTLQHEIGHLLGLDHSGVLSSTMYPFVSKDQATDLDSDDRISIANLYPRVDPTLVGATLTGRVTGNEGGVFGAQVVAVNEHGEPVASALTEQNGEYILEAVPSGTYRIYAEPLDGPVGPQHFAGIYREAKSTSFRTQFASGSSLQVDAGKVYGNLMIDTTGAPVRLNPKWIGQAAPDSSSLSLYSSVVALKAGQTVTIAVGGDGFTSGMTTFTVLNPGFRRTSDFRWAGNYVSATFEIASDIRPGASTVLVSSGSDTAALSGAVRVEGLPGAPRTRRVRR